MLLATMRTRFKEQAHGLADNVDDTTIDAYINRAYLDKIPVLVPGLIVEGYWNLTLEVGVGTIAYDDYVISLKPGAQLDEQPVTITNDPAAFWGRWDVTFTDSNAKPVEILNYQRQLL